MAIEYNFKYMPLVGKLPGKSMAQQTETAINEIAKIVNNNVAQAEIINTLAEQANTNSANALEKANEALSTSGRVYVTVDAVDLDSYCESELLFISNIASTNLPTPQKGFLEVKTNDEKTQATQVYIALTKDVYVRTGAIMADTVGDTTTYTASYDEWVKLSTSVDIRAYLALAGGTMSGDIQYSSDDWKINGTDINNDGQLSIIGATDDLNGSSLNLYGSNHATNGGEFSLKATNGTVTKELVGKPDGTLKWDGALRLQDEGEQYRDVDCIHSDGNRVGTIRFQRNAGNNTVTIGASDAMDSAPKGIDIIRKMGDGTTAGTVVVTAPTPAASDNSTEIATTAYVKANVPPSVGDANTPVYTDSNGKIVSTGKSFANYLPLAGGTMSGAIKFSGNAYIQNVNGITVFQHQVMPDGSEDTVILTPDHAQALRLRTGNILLFAGKNVERIDSSSISANGGWIRYVNGLQIVWNLISITSTSTTFTFAKAFASTPIITGSPSGLNTYSISSPSNTGFACRHGGSASSSMYLRYIAIGNWS